MGFTLATFDGVFKTLAHVNIRSNHRVSKYGVDVAALDSVVEAALALDRELYLVDEIGKMECFSGRFVRAMKTLMDGGEEVVATVALKGRGFIQEVKQRSDVEVWEVTRSNRDRMAERVVGWLERRGFGPAPGGIIGAPPVFLFEPHQPEQCGFEVQVLLDISPVFDRKRRAMEVMAAQTHLIRYYVDLARRRGVQAKRNSGRVGAKQEVFAEAYQRIFPEVVTKLA